MLDINKDQKHLIVSHLTTRDRRKPPSYSADANLRSHVVTHKYSRIINNLQQYSHFYSEKCILQVVSIIRALTHSEECIGHMSHR